MKQVTITFEKTFQLRDDQDPMTAARIWETDAGFKIVAVRPADMSADPVPDATIHTSDIPEVRDWSGAEVSKFYRATWSIFASGPTGASERRH